MLFVLFTHCYWLVNCHENMRIRRNFENPKYEYGAFLPLFLRLGRGCNFMENGRQTFWLCLLLKKSWGFLTFCWSTESHPWHYGRTGSNNDWRFDAQRTVWKTEIGHACRVRLKPQNYKALFFETRGQIHKKVPLSSNFLCLAPLLEFSTDQQRQKINPLVLAKGFKGLCFKMTRQ